MRYILFFCFFLIISCSPKNYSVHENNLAIDNKRMIKQDKIMKKKMIRARKLGTPKKSRIKTKRVKKIIY
jgi:hypothetical protein